MQRSIWDLPMAPLPAFPGPLGNAKYVVLGLGGSGLAAVHRLLDAGCQVTGIDAGQVGRSAAGRNGGFLLAGPAAFHHRARAEVGAELAREVYRLTVEGIDAMQQATPLAVHRAGSLRLPASEAERDDIAEHHEALRADGFLGERRPDGSLHVPDDAVFHPQERLDHLVESALRRGAWLYGDSPVLTLAPGEVLTSRGTLRCEGVVVAVDGGLEQLLPELAPRVQTVRLQMLATAPAPDVRVRGAVYYRGGLDYWQQRPDGRVALGGARDVGGDAEWGAPAEPSEAVQGALEERLRQVVGTSAEITDRWAARAGFTPNRWPLLQEIAERVWVTGGYSGTGNVMGHLGGQAAADALLGRPNPWLDAMGDVRTALL